MRVKLGMIVSAAAVGVGWSAAVAGAAVAGTVYDGSDYSYTTNHNSQAVICDREADARTAYVKGEEGDWSNYRVNDQDGSSGSCWLNSTPFPTNVRWHQTCEDINNAPDSCGAKSKHIS